MTPAITAAKRAGIHYQVHEYAHDPATESYGLEAADKLGVATGRVFKTLVVSHGERRLAVGIIPVDAMLSMKLMAKALGAKKAGMAPGADVERATGYVLGGVSPLGQKTRLPTLLDDSAAAYATIFVSAGRRGMDMELAPADLLALTHGRWAPLCQQSG